MGSLLVETGKRYGRLVVGERAGVDGTGWVTWHCVCDCGAASVVAGTNLRRGNVQSCGCLAVDRAREPKTHGESGSNRTDEYEAWHLMIQRCTNPRASGYANYGGRGVTVCDAWRDYAAFVGDIGRRPSKRHSLDRIDPLGNYEPDNVRWATAKEQARNKRVMKLRLEDVVTIKARVASGESQAAVARDFGIHSSGVSRIVRGLTWA